MDENRQLTELLGRDRESRAFFASLSPELRKLLMGRDIGNFETLKKAVEDCGVKTFAAEDMTKGQTASTTESTGVFPRGEDLSESKWRELGGR
jgi:hypothetical protein